LSPFRQQADFNVKFSSEGASIEEGCAIQVVSLFYKERKMNTTLCHVAKVTLTTYQNEQQKGMA